MDIDPPNEAYEKLGITPPEVLDALIDQLPDAPDYEISVYDYADVIVRLRDEKGFSFRAIVDFLGKHGVKTNRTTVHTVYHEEKNDPDRIAEDNQECP